MKPAGTLILADPSEWALLYPFVIVNVSVAVAPADRGLGEISGRYQRGFGFGDAPAWVARPTKIVNIDTSVTAVRRGVRYFIRTLSSAVGSSTYPA